MVNATDPLHYELYAGHKRLFERFQQGKLFLNVFDDPFLTRQGFNESDLQDYRVFTLTDLDEIYFHKIYGEKISSLDKFSNEEIQNCLFFVVFEFDSDALPLIKRIIENNGKFIPHFQYNKTPYRFVDKLCFNAISNTASVKDRLTHFSPKIYENICQALDYTKNISGNYLEIGVFSGGSALVALNYYREQTNLDVTLKRDFYFIDTFSGFDYEKARSSSDMIWKETHKFRRTKDSWIQAVEETLNSSEQKFNLIDLNITSEELPNIGPLSVANVDVDLYEATLTSLKKVSGLVVSGGIIICEDPPSTPGLYGAAFAVEEFLNSALGQKFKKLHLDSQVFLIKE
ncbi:TylF/MycF family methyltransferase [SAR116 cluster bacterium]|nr:TylF/MycF family methyltransferase [SAR116 cluster bacterium]